jgi:hypothetical protein
MVYFAYPLDIHGWKTKPKTEPDRFRGPEPENRGWEIIPESEPVKPETRGYPTRNRLAAILNDDYNVSITSNKQLICQFLKLLACYNDHYVFIYIALHLRIPLLLHKRGIVSLVREEEHIAKNTAKLLLCCSLPSPFQPPARISCRKSRPPKLCPLVYLHK